MKLNDTLIYGGRSAKVIGIHRRDDTTRRYLLQIQGQRKVVRRWVSARLLKP